MTKRREVLLNLVKKEAKFLRDKLTNTEKKRLDFSTLDPFASGYCIYGQATGNCNNTRSLELILDGCERVYKRVVNKEIKDMPLNGKPYWLNTAAEMGAPSRIYSYYSPIEVFIAEEGNENNKNLLEYIKGTKNKLFIK